MVGEPDPASAWPCPVGSTPHAPCLSRTRRNGEGSGRRHGISSAFLHDKNTMSARVHGA